MKHHVKDSLYFERHPDTGEVTVDFNGNRLTMSGQEWIEAVAAVSEQGAKNRPLAREVHGKIVKREEK